MASVGKYGATSETGGEARVHWLLVTGKMDCAHGEVILAVAVLDQAQVVGELQENVDSGSLTPLK